MAKDTSELCELCGGQIVDDRCYDCDHEEWNCDCTCDACIMAEGDWNDDDDEEVIE
jgi:hypothetical protein